MKEAKPGKGKAKAVVSGALRGAVWTVRIVLIGIGITAVAGIVITAIRLWGKLWPF